MDTTLRERFRWVSFEALAAGGRGSRPLRSPPRPPAGGARGPQGAAGWEGAGAGLGPGPGGALGPFWLVAAGGWSPRPLLNWVSPCLSSLSASARLGKWLSTSSTLEPSAWPRVSAEALTRAAPCSPRVAPCGHLRLVFWLGSPQRGLPGPERCEELFCGRTSSGYQGTFLPRNNSWRWGPSFPQGPRRASLVPGTPMLKGSGATWSFKLLLQWKRKKQTSLLEEPTRDGGAEPGRRPSWRAARRAPACPGTLGTLTWSIQEADEIHGPETL